VRKIIGTVQIIQVDDADSLGFILTEELLDRLKAKVGDDVYLTNTPDGLILSSDFSRQHGLARQSTSTHSEEPQ
jgi:hypothetical protein